MVDHAFAAFDSRVFLETKYVDTRAGLELTVLVDVLLGNEVCQRSLTFLPLEELPLRLQEGRVQFRNLLPGEPTWRRGQIYSRYSLYN